MKWLMQVLFLLLAAGNDNQRLGIGLMIYKRMITLQHLIVLVQEQV